MTAVPWLELKLEGPMASFGTTMIDNRGPTGRFPGRSMLTGLIANALGWRRTEPDRLDSLQARLVAVSIAGPGPPKILTDFQAAEITMNDTAWTTRGSPAVRKGSPATYDGPHLRYREYIEDLRLRVLLRLDPAGADPILEEVAAAIEQPARPLFLGRKCCPPSTPMRGRTLDLPADPELAARAAAETDEAGGTMWWNPEPAAAAPARVRSYSVCDERRHTTGLHGGTRMIWEAAIAPAAAGERDQPNTKEEGCCT